MMGKQVVVYTSPRLTNAAGFPALTSSPARRWNKYTFAAIAALAATTACKCARGYTSSRDEHGNCHCTALTTSGEMGGPVIYHAVTGAPCRGVGGCIPYFAGEVCKNDCSGAVTGATGPGGSPHAADPVPQNPTHTEPGFFDGELFGFPKIWVYGAGAVAVVGAIYLMSGKK